MYTLTSLQLYACTLVHPLRNEKSIEIFSDIIENLNKLSGDGLEIVLQNKKKVFNGFLIMFLGDTPAQNWLGGFKESCSKAISFCRNCDIQHGQIAYDDSEVVLRNLNSHKKRLEKLQRCKVGKEHDDYSKKTGINYKSSLLKINYFDICKSLLQDPMHIFWECFCHLELALFLNICINNQVFTLEYFNKQIKTFKYFKMDKTDIPNEITLNNIAVYTFTQTSGQMSTLFHNLPLLLGEKILLHSKENENYENLLRLIQIINLVYCFVFNERTISELRNEIKIYLKNFKLLYPEINMTPKMHFLIHFSSQMKEFDLLGMLQFIEWRLKILKAKNIALKIFIIFQSRYLKDKKKNGF